MTWCTKHHVHEGDGPKDCYDNRVQFTILTAPDAVVRWGPMVTREPQALQALRDLTKQEPGKRFILVRSICESVVPIPAEPIVVFHIY